MVIMFGSLNLLYIHSPSCITWRLYLFSSHSGCNCIHQDQADLGSLLISSIIRCWCCIGILALANTFVILCLMSSKFLWQPRQSSHNLPSADAFSCPLFFLTVQLPFLWWPQPNPLCSFFTCSDLLHPAYST